MSRSASVRTSCARRPLPAQEEPRPQLLPLQQQYLSPPAWYRTTSSVATKVAVLAVRHRCVVRVIMHRDDVVELIHGRALRQNPLDLPTKALHNMAIPEFDEEATADARVECEHCNRRFVSDRVWHVDIGAVLTVVLAAARSGSAPIVSPSTS